MKFHYPRIYAKERMIWAFIVGGRPHSKDGQNIGRVGQNNVHLFIYPLKRITNIPQPI
jgi:hypothetical protein